MHRAILCSANGDGHLVAFTGLEHNVSHGLELHIPEVVTFFGRMNFHTVGSVKGDGVTKI